MVDDRSAGDATPTSVARLTIHEDADAARRQSADRITVALISQAADDLQTLQERTGLSKTDIVNRAITLYEFIDAQLRTGQDLLIRDKATGETQLVRFL
jgi:hypothetical protein